MKIRLFVLKNIKKYTGKLIGSILGLILFSLLSVPVSLISPKFFQILIDEVMIGRNLDKFIIVAFGLLSVYVLRFINDGMTLLLSNRVLNSFTYNLRMDIFHKYILSPYSFLEKKETGELKMRLIDDVDSLGNFIKGQVADYIGNLLMVVGTLYLSLRINVKMALCCLAIIPFVFLINCAIGVGTKRINEEIRTVNSQYFTSTHNSLQFWREIKAQNAEKTFINRFKGYWRILARLGLKSIRYWAYREVFNDFKANYLTKVMVYIIGSFFVIRNEISVGTLILFSEYFAMLFSALDGLNSKRVELKTSEPYYKRIFETFSFPDECVGKLPFHNLEKEITVRNLDFSYDMERPVLKHLNLQIEKGDYIAIVGKTGCGKTTLIKLLMGQYEIGEGQILYDGVDITRIDKRSLYHVMGVVMQDHYLFNLSIRENLLLADEKATEEEMIAACKKANIYDFIAGLPNGLETQIGERGVKLSGGQRQRLAIAAAVLRKPQILILDEATSSLDKASENAVNDAVNLIAKDITVIVITHKPAMALKAKKVAVMEDGRITAVGTHEQLLHKNAFYMSLAEASKMET